MNRPASSLQRIGLALLVVSSVCGYRAVSAYQEAVAAAKLLSEQVDLITFEAPVPRETHVMGAVAVVLAVAAVRCLIQARVSKRSAAPDLLK